MSSFVVSRPPGVGRIGHPDTPDLVRLSFPLIAIALFGVVLFVLHFGGSVGVLDSLPTALLVTFTVAPLLAGVLSSRYDLFSPFHLVAAYFFLCYGARCIYVALNPHAIRLGLLEYDDYLPTAAWMALAAYGAFAVGYASQRSPAFAKRILRILPQFPRRAPIGRLVFLAGVGIVAHICILYYGVVIGHTYTQSGMREMAESPIPGWLPPCAGLVEIVFCIATLYAMGSNVTRQSRVFCKWLAWTCFALALFKTLSQGIREYILLVLALWVLCYHYQRRRVRAGTIAAVLAGGMIIFPFVQVLREISAGRASGTPSNLVDVANLANNSVAYLRSLSAADVANIALSSVFDRSQGIDALSLVAKYTPERAAWGLGSSYLDIPMQLFVPRALWADKPIVNAHQDFERAYMGIRFFAQASPHIFSDFYSNFALPGLLTGGFILGFLFKHFYLMLKYSAMRTEVLFIYVYVVLNAIHQFEAAFVASSVIMVRLVIVVTLTTFILSMDRRHDHSAVSASR